jgi:hypothetical protein
VLFVVGLGREDLDVYFITIINKEHEEKHTFYTISYEDLEELDYQLFLYHSHINGGTIRFKNLGEIEWYRDLYSIKGPGTNTLPGGI